MVHPDLQAEKVDHEPHKAAIPGQHGRGAPVRREIPAHPAGPGAGWRPLRIAMIGQKGMPATYGGIERHVEEVASRLAGYGHEVTVYCRESYGSMPLDRYRGVRLRQVRTVASKHLDAIVHAATSTMAAMGERPDIVHYHGLGPGLVAPLPRWLSRARVVLTVHGLDNQRDKWGAGARAVLGSAHWMSGYVPHRRVAVSRGLAAHYETRFGRPTSYIPNGVNAARPLPARQIGARFGLTPGGYLILVGRLVPEKAADLLIRAFRRSDTRMRLAIVGGSSFTDDFVAKLRREAEGDERIVFTGFAYGDLLAELYANAAGFVQPSRLEGLPLTLLEAAAYGLPVVASDIAPHVEVLESDAPGQRLFRDGDEEDLLRALAPVLADPAAERVGAEALRDRVTDLYSWDTATRELEQLYLELARVPGRRARARLAARAPAA
ncbi:glycosyltransferase family 4 protein [Micromonospora sp. NBC_01796]|uniref:glycosyltransferase family 4 protein n=1 Tax=Micromonospora sp. NBC_01796 TaxID=2975987 RepID=UPI002DD89232|nr:glycosyltransferase family 4 protein [Micromonospora sp. NBC_01796]WSA86493.1 glycosyltransferase family 4 protein [Micromonospora sp. NBC_01796]